MEADESPRAAGRRSKMMSRSSNDIGSGSGIDIGSGSTVEYTSLRDMLQEGSGGGELSHNDHNIHEFDASNIGIRNQLLKHAASAYLQSAVVVTGSTHDNEGCCLSRLWVRLRSRGQGCVDELCAAFIAAFSVGIWT